MFSFLEEKVDDHCFFVYVLFNCNETNYMQIWRFFNGRQPKFNRITYKIYVVSTGINDGSNARISSIFLLTTNDNCQSPPRPRTQKWLYLSRLIIPGDYVYVPYPLITSNGWRSVTVVRASLTGNWRANLSNTLKKLKQMWRSSIHRGDFRIILVKRKLCTTPAASFIRARFVVSGKVGRVLRCVAMSNVCHGTLSEPLNWR